MYWQLFWFHLAKKRICRICCKRTCNQHLYYCEWKPREISENLNRFLIIDSNSIDPKLYRTRGDVMKIEHFSRAPKNISSKYGTIFKISGSKLPEKFGVFLENAHFSEFALIFNSNLDHFDQICVKVSTTFPNIT